jgi:protein TonB
MTEITQWAKTPSVMGRAPNRRSITRLFKPARNNNAQKNPNIKPGDRLSLTFFLATIMHAIVILGISFDPSIATNVLPPSLEVILVQMSTKEAPDAAKYIAQVNQQASGTREKGDRPSSPFMGASTTPSSGTAPISLQINSAPNENRQRSVIVSYLKSPLRTAKPEQYDINQETNHRKKTTHSSRRLEIARLSAELAASEKQYASQPRIHYMDTLSAKTALEARYIKTWVDKVERIGNLNYPDEARRRKLSGALILHVLLGNDGMVEKVEIGSSSGQQVLDDAAIRIIKLASPFDRFPEEMRGLYDKLMITRTWLFQSGDTLVTR